MRSLAGLRIVITRAAHQAEELARPLRELSAEVILLPVIVIAPPQSPEPLRQAAAQTNAYDWIIFTSANAVSAFAGELTDPSQIGNARIAAIGAATRDAAQRHGLLVSLTPEKYVAESLADAFRDEDLNGRRILIPSAAVTRDAVAPELRKQGAEVDVVEAYRNVMPAEAAESAQSVFREPYPHWVTFASSSAVDRLVQLVGAATLRRVKIASIGPITSATVRKYGLTVAAEAREHTVEGLIEAVCAVAAEHPTQRRDNAFRRLD